MRNDNTDLYDVNFNAEVVVVVELVEHTPRIVLRRIERVHSGLRIVVALILVSAEEP